MATRVPRRSSASSRGTSGESRSRLPPSSYSVTSPSKVTRSSGPPWRASVMACAVLRIRRTSLNEGATKRRREMNRRASWCTKASLRQSGVKKTPTEGTRSLSLDISCVPASWCRTGRALGRRVKGLGPTVVVDELLDVADDLEIAPLRDGGHLLRRAFARLKDSGGLRVQDEGDGEQSLGASDLGSG